MAAEQRNLPEVYKGSQTKALSGSRGVGAPPGSESTPAKGSALLGKQEAREEKEREGGQGVLRRFRLRI